MLGTNTNRSRLLDQAREEIITMLEKAHEVYEIAWATLTEDGSGDRIDDLDQDINSGERMVRRLVIEHLTLNPQQDLPSSLTLVSIVHDVERLGDYAKSIAELATWGTSSLSNEGLGAKCREVQAEIEPLFTLAIEGIRDDDESKASDLMTRHKAIKAKTDTITQESLQTDHHPEVRAVLASRYLRRVSAHLSNIVSSITNPFDLISRDE